MATYIQLLTLTAEGRKRALEDPRSVLRAQASVSIPGIQSLGLYGVLGDYDFVNIVQAEDNDTVAQFSLELGVMCDAHVETLPAIPISGLVRRDDSDTPAEDTATSVPLPEEVGEDG